MDETDVLEMLPAWVCTYYLGSDAFGIVLRASDPEQIENDFKHFGERGIIVEGRLAGIIEV